VKSFQFIRLINFNKSQAQEMINALNSSMSDGNPIIFMNTKIHVEENESKNIQVITITNY